MLRTLVLELPDDELATQKLHLTPIFCHIRALLFLFLFFQGKINHRRITARSPSNRLNYGSLRYIHVSASPVLRNYLSKNTTAITITAAQTPYIFISDLVVVPAYCKPISVSRR